MNSKKFFSAYLLIFLTNTAWAQSYSVNADDDTCWEPPNWCLSANASWDQYTEDKINVRYENVCQHRVYIRMCNQRMNGTEDCGATGLSPGRTTTWYTYNASGSYRYNMVGVLTSSKDWVCAGKVYGWND